MNRAIFLDRDGVLIEEKHYLHRTEDAALIAGAGPALKKLSDAGFLLFVVTNQSGVGRGYFTMEDVNRVHAFLEQEFAASGVHFQKIYIAPEAPDQPSRGRKPSPQFLFDARDEYNLDLNQSAMIGDKLIDLECGWNAGLRHAILVRTGYGAKTEQENQDNLQTALVVDNLEQAAQWLLKSI